MTSSGSISALYFECVLGTNCKHSVCYAHTLCMRPSRSYCELFFFSRQASQVIYLHHNKHVCIPISSEVICWTGIGEIKYVFKFSAFDFWNKSLNLFASLVGYTRWIRPFINKYSCCNIYTDQQPSAYIKISKFQFIKEIYFVLNVERSCQSEHDKIVTKHRGINNPKHYSLWKII